MKAHFEHTFERGFILKEEHLARLADIVDRRLGSAPPHSKFKVYRRDSFVAEVGAVADVVSEENSIRNAIEKLEIVNVIKGPIFLIKFEKQRATQIKIEGDDRDQVLLLASEIREYIATEVCKARKSLGRESVRPVILLAAPVALLTLLSLIFFEPKTSITKEAATQSADLAAKLNYLIERAPTSTRSSKWVTGSLTVVLLITFLLEPAITLVRKAWPNDVFLWGREVERFEKLESRREKVFWGVGVTSVLGILCSVVAYYITKGR